jgi:[ribosomal protein S18]-alanine N-acetyltransferase
VTLRSATVDDLPVLVDLEREAFGADAWDERAVLGELEGPGRRVVVADGPAGEPLGYAVSMTLGDIVDLQRIVVRPQQRRTGLATALLHHLLDHAGAADRMLLEVSERNVPAVAFYRAHGFTRIDVRPRYYRDGSDALVLQRTLAPVTGGSVSSGTPGPSGPSGPSGTMTP